MVRVSAWEFAWVPGLLGLWRHGFIGCPRIEGQRCCCRLLAFFCWACRLSFVLSWPLCVWLSTVDDLEVGGVSLVEVLILYERWAGERLVLEMSVPKQRRSGRPISVSAVRSGPSIDTVALLSVFGCHVESFGWFGLVV